MSESSMRWQDEFRRSFPDEGAMIAAEKLAAELELDFDEVMNQYLPGWDSAEQYTSAKTEAMAKALAHSIDLVGIREYSADYERAQQIVREEAQAFCRKLENDTCL